MSTTRVTLVALPGEAKPGRRELAEVVFGKLNVILIRIIDTPSGYVLLCHKEDDVDKLVSNTAQEQLKKIKLAPKMPPALAARRSIICRKLDSLVGDNTPEDIKREVERANPWAKIAQVIKFKDYTHILKIVFATTECARKAKENGILAFHLKIVPDQIEQEEFINIKTCFTCYALDCHLTKECPKKDAIVCSECAQEGHTWRQCTSEVKKCLNCQGGHRTLAMACPKKKEIIRRAKEEKNQESQKQETRSYANAAKAVIQEERAGGTTFMVENESTLDVVALFVHAHLMNIARPGTFQTEINKSLKANGMQKELIFPENPPSGEILKLNISRKEDQTEGIQVQPRGIRRQRSCMAEDLEKKWKRRLENECELDMDSSEIESIVESTYGSRTSLAGSLSGSRASLVETRVQELETNRAGAKPKTAPKYVYEGKNIALKILVPESFPSERIENTKDIVNELKHQTLKWEYEHTMTEQSVWKALTQGTINITKSCIQILSNEAYKKKKSGRIRRKSVEETARERSKPSK